ncbi:hypothetical protein POM88_000180 [Heracleum sosnowskyi]|uniref:RNase H type-1 domain-containing protein n=1 Tax=Heracleum sosnowskyi TaxID=360622 RepID=A0AAD8N3R8_9APIA|nr:hypothetical protein POM88_000180 [Heracleum sosnowskyi]
MTWLIRDVDHGGGGSFRAETPDYGGKTQKQAKSTKNTQDKGSTEVGSEGPLPSEGPIPTKGPMPSQGSTAPRPKKKKKSIPQVTPQVPPQVPPQMPPQVPPQVPPQMPNDHSQGGIFSCANQSAKPTNTMKQLQKTRNEKMAALKKKERSQMRASVVGIMKHNGRWVRGFGSMIGLADPQTAELWAIYYGLRMAWEREMTYVVVFTERSDAIDLINNPDPA